MGGIFERGLVRDVRNFNVRDLYMAYRKSRAILDILLVLCGESILLVRFLAFDIVSTRVVIKGGRKYRD